MPKEKNISWHWEIKGFPDTFKLVKHAEKFLLKHGEFDKIYKFTKVTTPENHRHPISGKVRWMVKTRVNYVCDVCDCIRRTKIMLIDVPSENYKRDPYEVKWIDKTQTCTNPACIEYKKYLTKHKVENGSFGSCKLKDCDRTALGNKNCPMHGGPPLENDEIIHFEDYSCGKYRTSEHGILKKLRFLDNSQDDWLLDDKDQSIESAVSWLLENQVMYDLWTDEEYKAYQDMPSTTDPLVGDKFDSVAPKLQELDDINDEMQEHLEQTQM